MALSQRSRRVAVQKVHQGDRLRIKATEWNEIASHVNGATRVPSEGTGRGQRLAIVYNFTGKDLTRGCVVKLTGTRYQQGAFFNACVFKAELPATGEDEFIPAVTAEAIKNGACGRAFTSGLAPVRIASGSGMHGTPNGQGTLALSDDGPIIVIQNANDANWKYAILGGLGNGAAKAKGPFDAELTHNEENGWKLTCIDTLARQNAGYVHCGSYTCLVSKRTWTVTAPCFLFLSISYTPLQDDSGDGTYAIDVYAEAELPTLAQDERRIIERLAQITGNAEDGFRLHKYRTPGDYTVTGRWVR